MGPSYAALGFPGGQDLGLAMATVGLLSSTLVGGVVVVIGRQRGWLLAQAREEADSNAVPRALAGVGDSGLPPNHPAWAAWAVNLAMVGIAVLIGVVLLQLLHLGTDAIGGGVAEVGNALPVFPLAIIGSLLVRWWLERSGLSHWASTPIQNEIGTLSADLLITSATACLNLALLAADWLPLTVLALSGLSWNLGITLLLAPRLLPPDWFERAVLEFGQATGVAASGLLLLRMADPDDHSQALPAFSLKQLFLQPFLAGGVVTVVAPLAVAGWGLPIWTGFCLALVLLAGGAGLLLAQWGRNTEASAAHP
jgi:ESS family glutamate:Na+ symporter